MTVFNPNNKESLTYEESLSPAMRITEESDAKQYLAQYVSYIQRYLDKEPRTDDLTALEIAKINIGYYSGYYNNTTAERVKKLFSCIHPIFGQ